jgi:hypothetical protein
MNPRGLQRRGTASAVPYFRGRSKACPFFLVFLALVLVAHPLRGQSLISSCDAEQVTPNLDLIAERSFSGKLSDVSGEMMPHYPLELRLGTSKKPFRFANTDDAGKFQFKDVPAGRYRLILKTRAFKQPTGMFCPADAGRPCDLNVMVQVQDADHAYSQCPPR